MPGRRAAFELLTTQTRRRETIPGGTTRTTLLEQLARAPTDEPLLEFQCHGTERVTYREGDVFWEPGIDRPPRRRQPQP